MIFAMRLSFTGGAALLVVLRYWWCDVIRGAAPQRRSAGTAGKAAHHYKFPHH
jgi:hypothetical protein